MFICEIKLLLSSYKKILSGAFFLALFCLLTAALASALPERGLFAPFTIGIVDGDGSPEVSLLLEMLKSHEKLSRSVGFERLSPGEAAARLESGGIPAYVSVPEGFSQGVMNGENPPLALVGNESRTLQLSAARLLIGAGVAFLTTSQAGIYSALNYAYERGMAWEDVLSRLVIPVNVEYMKALLAYDDYFDRTELTATDGMPRGEYYLSSALIFLMYIFPVTLAGAAARSSAPAVMRRLRMAGIPLVRAMFAKWLALWLLFSALMLPLAPFRGTAVFAAAAFFSGLSLMSAVLFADETAAGLFLFLFAAVMLFVSGGALPLAFLPEVFGKISVLTPNYWFIRANVSGLVPHAVFCGYAALFFALACAGARARRGA